MLLNEQQKKNVERNQGIAVVAFFWANVVALFQCDARDNV